MSLIFIKDLNKNFGPVKVLKNINLEIKDKEFVVLVGPSGCGKTTLLNIISGLIDHDNGTIRIDDKPVDNLAPKDRDIAMVFQNYALYPSKKVYNNMAFSLKFKKIDAPEFSEYIANDGKKLTKKQLVDLRVKETAKILQITDLLDRKPGELSGGQRQRVAMGRALVRKPKAFLLDEPLSNLDAILRVSMRQEIKDLHKKLGTTMIYVTHDQVEAMTLADRIVVMKDGEILQIGSPLVVYNKPQNTFVAKFIGSPPMNMIPAKVIETDNKPMIHFQGCNIILPASEKEKYRTLIKRKIQLGIRSEDISIYDNVPKNFKIKSTTLSYEPLGNQTLLYSDINGEKVVVSLNGNLDIIDSEDFKEQDLFINLDKLHIFDEKTGNRITEHEN